LIAPIVTVPLEVFKAQRHAIVAVAVLAHLNQAAQPAAEQRELPDLFVDRPELGLGSTDDVVGGVEERDGEVGGGPEQVPDLAQGEPSRRARRMKASRHRSASLYSR
jgi:hypothetical protein